MKGKQLFFTIGLIVFVLMIGVGGSELILRYSQHQNQKSDHLDAGFIRYNRYLGWSLSSNWQGQHRHHDFTVNYSINRNGFRGELPPDAENNTSRYVVLGDSFTFGFGVNNDETFVHLLNVESQPEEIFFNLAVPGYSTDQELLLLQKKVSAYDPEHLILMAYLGNDLYDSQLPFPLQANNAKPYFELGPDNSELILKNSPVPLETKTREQARQDRQKVLGFWDDSRANPVTRYLDKFALLRMLKLQLYPFPDFSAEFEKSHRYTLELFTAIIQEIQVLSLEKRIRLTVVLLAGQTFMKFPKSPDAQAQDYFRKEIVRSLSQLQIEVLDLAFLLRERYDSERPKTRWYYPNEGHLTPEGHRIVAEILSQYIHE